MRGCRPAQAVTSGFSRTARRIEPASEITKGRARRARDTRNHSSASAASIASTKIAIRVAAPPSTFSTSPKKYPAKSSVSAWAAALARFHHQNRRLLIPDSAAENDTNPETGPRNRPSTIAKPPNRVSSAAARSR